MNNIRFIRVWTNGSGQIDPLTDAYALQLLHEQYGEAEGTRCFVNLATKKAGCASGGRSSVESFMIEFRGELGS